MIAVSVEFHHELGFTPEAVDLEAGVARVDPDIPFGLRDLVLAEELAKALLQVAPRHTLVELTHRVDPANGSTAALPRVALEQIGHAVGIGQAEALRFAEGALELIVVEHLAEVEERARRAGDADAADGGCLVVLEARRVETDARLVATP